MIAAGLKVRRQIDRSDGSSAVALARARAVPDWRRPKRLSSAVREVTLIRLRTPVGSSQAATDLLATGAGAHGVARVRRRERRVSKVESAKVVYKPEVTISR